MISHWEGKWGEDVLVGADGPPSPKYRGVTDKPDASDLWDDPKGFNNHYRKRLSYPSGAWAHSDTEIP